MATTTNFGWETPDDTDLVKDGALAIRTLGSAIDTSLVDLKGGTTGQVLSKTSNTDMDFAWVTSDDANAIQNAIVDAKGDLITATAADTPARLAVGTDGHVLTADSTTATGLKWAAASSGASFSGVRLTKSANQTISNNTATAITFNTETYDTDGFHDNTTNNSRITIPSGKGGYYRLAGYVPKGTQTSGQADYRVYKNGSLLTYNSMSQTGSGSNGGAAISDVLNLAVGDYLEIYFFQDSGSNVTVYGGNETVYFSVQYLGA